MDEFLAKKTGEVLAFSLVAVETFNKGEQGFEKIFGKEKLDNIVSSNSSFVDRIKKAGEETGVIDSIVQKSEKTSEKLRNMRDLYLANESDWNDPAELSEWMGFFLGAAYVHWSLVSGHSANANLTFLSELSKEAEGLNKDLLEEVAIFVKEI